MKLVSKSQCYPLYYYTEATQGSLFGESLERQDEISDFILSEARKCFGDVSKEDIFYYVYGFLHLPSYREKFSAELKESLPRIILSDKFWELSRASFELRESTGSGRRGSYWRRRFSRKKNAPVEGQDDFDLQRAHHDKKIPPRSFEYVVNGHSSLEWIIDRYQVKTDTASGIINNPNDWSFEHDNPRYILNLILSSITVSLKTLDIIENLLAVEL